MNDSMTSNQNTTINFNENDFKQISAQSRYTDPIYSDLISTTTPGKILDVGCGNGHFSSIFIENKIHIDGIDGSQEALDECKKRGFQNCYHTDNIDVDELVEIPADYDLIVCKDFLEHLVHPEKLVKNLFKKLKSGGRLFVHVPNHFTLFYRIKFLFTGNIDTQNFFPEWNEWNNPHIRFFTHKGIQDLLLESGFKIERDYSSHFFFFTPYLTSTMVRLGLSKLLLKISTNLFSRGYSILAKKHEG